MKPNAAIKTITTGYTPRPLQLYLHNSVARFNVIVCHRRFGKTVWSLNEMIDRALRNKLKNPQYAYFAPTYGQAKRVAWDYLKEYTKHIPGATPNEAELRVDIPRPGSGDRIRIMLLGAENPGAIRGIYLDGAVLDEYAEMYPEVWSQVIRPALSDRKGWAIFIGTPKGRNHFYDLLEAARNLQGWFTKVFKASETKLIDNDELAAARATMSEEEYDQEFECSFAAALVGSYYGKLIDVARKEGRLRSVPHDPLIPVDTYWDLGIGDTTCIWFGQQVFRELHWIDYYEVSGVGLADIVRVLLNEKRYNYREHILPHDAGARELGTGRTREETLRTLGLNRTTILPRLAVDDGINACRLILPRSYFDEKKCERGILALESYEKKWDSKNKIFMPKPLHNWASHGADAFRSAGIGLRDESARINASNRPRFADSDFNVLD